MSYADFYLSTIRMYLTGLKLAGGGTGLGKTSGIPAVVRDPTVDRKSVYIPNRIQLVQEMVANFVADPEHVVVLPRDLDAVLKTLAELRPEFDRLIESATFRDHLKQARAAGRIRKVDVATIHHACRILDDYARLEVNNTLAKAVQATVDHQARIVLRAFRAVLRAAKGNGTRARPTTLYTQWLDDPVVQSLFPYIAFKRRPEARLLIVTVQKAYQGFFNGERTINMTGLFADLGSLILFLDEFEYLEHDLASLICDAAQIENPFRLVEFFHREMERHKLPKLDYPIPPATPSTLRDQIEEIQQLITDLNSQGYPFPALNQFTSAVAHHAKIFRTRHTMSTSPLYLEPTTRAFHLIDTPQTGMLPAWTLFNTVGTASSRIIALFKEIEHEDDIIYREILRQCYEGTDFLEQMDAIAQVPRTLGPTYSQQGTLLETGYQVYDIHHLEQITDREEVEVRFFAMHTTPEAILVDLANQHLVFGLSATADIPRSVHHFALDGLAALRGADGEGDAATPPLLIPPTEDDRALIMSLNTAKAAQRKNQVVTQELNPLDTNVVYERRWHDFVHAVASDERFGHDPNGYLKQRADTFFATLLHHVVPAPADATHLVFLTSFRQIRLIFEHYGAEDPQLFTATREQQNPWFDMHRVTLAGNAMLVVFFNAEFALAVNQSAASQLAFRRMFWQGLPVVVVTQYLSAGNGVNLQYYRSEAEWQAKRSHDFTHLHLLETPYYYFNKADEDLAPDERIALLKENIWYLAKLYTAKYVSRSQFLSLLANLHDPAHWNHEYHTQRAMRGDALLNNIATYMQAIGRIERVWTAMPDQQIVLAHAVLVEWQRFVIQYEDLWREREAISASNLQAVVRAVQDTMTQAERLLRRRKNPDLSVQNRACQTAIMSLVGQLNQVRHQEGEYHPIRAAWQHVRQAVLRHDFADDLLRRYHCVFDSPHYCDGVLRYTEHMETVPADVSHPFLHHWRPDSLYQTIRQHPAIATYFRNRGYELSFRSAGACFTPYCWQAILAGAIGEEASTALLREAGIMLEDVPDPLFELIDAKIVEHPWYIDSKNYHDGTLDRFPADPQDPSWHPKMNEDAFRESAQRKLAALQQYHGGDGKLIYLNLLSADDRPLGYYDERFHPVPDFASADIILIQGALRRAQPSVPTTAFTLFCRDIIPHL